MSGMDTNAPIDDSQRECMSLWMAYALERMPYLASTLLAMRPVSSPGLGTVAVDAGYRLYIDFPAMTQHSDRFCSEALLHEAMHLLSDHASRSKPFPGCASAWNIAADCEINDGLVEAGCSELAEACVLPEHIGQPRHLLAEAYMEAQQNQQGQGQQQNQQQNQQQGQGQNQQQGQGFDGCGSGSGGELATCELPADDDLGGAAPAASEVEHKRTKVATAQAIRDHESRSRGSVPAGLVEMADMILAPSQVPWRTVLSAALRRAAAMRSGDWDVSYARRNRRRPKTELAGGRRLVNPGTFSPIPTIVVVRDTSGSMSDADLSTASSEVEGIARQLGVRGRDLIVLDVDAAVEGSHTYQGAASISEVIGRGGTDMRVGIEAAVKLRPNAVVVITDGATPWPEVQPRVPVVVCVVGGDEREMLMDRVPDWAQKVAVDTSR